MATTSVHSYDPLDPGVLADPYPFYDVLRRDAPVAHVESLQAYAVSRHADVRRVMHEHETFSSKAMADLIDRPASYSRDAGRGTDADDNISIIGTDGPTHARLRTIVNRGFSPRRMGELEDEMRAVARRLVSDAPADAPWDLHEVLAAPLPTTVISTLLGVDPARRDDFHRWSADMIFGVFEQASPEQQGAVADSAAQMADWIDRTVAARADTDGDDLISVLLRAELEGGALSANEVRAFVFTLLVAGSITTAYLIANATAALLDRPELWAACRQDTTRVGAVIEESLRYDAPVQIMFRTTTRDVEIAGARLPAGTTILALLGSANRDPEIFDDAERFDPSRDTRDHLAFGHGVHFCLGAALARLEARVALEVLLEDLPNLRLAGPATLVDSMVFRGPASLPVSAG